MKSLQKNLSRAALVATANIAALAAGQASAQEFEAPGADEDAIVVTGSRIRVDPLTQTRPIIQVAPKTWLAPVCPRPRTSCSGCRSPAAA
jgi:hypothetical protein